MSVSQQQIPIPGAEAFDRPQQTALSIIERAIMDPNLSADKLSVLLDVQLRYEANEARKKFEAAFEQFKRQAPEIFKSKHVSFPTSGGGRTDYHHAELHIITPIIAEALLAVGISHFWRTSDVNGKTTVTCILKGFGHTEEAATLSGPADTSGGKNNIQAIGSTVSYLERYTLLAATGIAAKGQDDDGKTEGMTETAIAEYCTSIKDSSSFDEAKARFAAAWNASKSVNDLNAQSRFQAVYETRKKELRGQK